FTPGNDAQQLVDGIVSRIESSGDNLIFVMLSKQPQLPKHQSGYEWQTPIGAVTDPKMIAFGSFAQRTDRIAPHVSRRDVICRIGPHAGRDIYGQLPARRKVKKQRV